MSNPDHLSKLREMSAEQFNAWREEKKGQLDLSGADLSNQDLRGKHLTSVSLESAILKNANMRGVAFTTSNLSRADFTGAHLHDAVFRNVNDLTLTIFKDAHLPGADLSQATFSGCDFTDADLTDTSLRITDFRRCIFDRADFSNASVDSRTNFGNTRSCKDMKLDRYTLESLGKDYGGLTVGQRMDMKIRYDLGQLKRVYSGFFQWFQFASLTLFLAPYASFVALQWFKSSVAKSHGDKNLLMALLHYIKTGGSGWEAVSPELNFWSVTLFSLLVLYNVGRVFLLFQTKKLEIQEEATGLPSDFKLEGGWKRLFKFTFYGAFFAMGLALINAGYFLWTTHVAAA